jgi:hypothetical protein
MAHTQFQTLISVVKMATVLEERPEEQRFVVRFMSAKGIEAKNYHKGVFHVYDGNCLSRKTV